MVDIPGQQLGQELPAMLRLALGGTTMAVVYGGILVFFVGHRALYADVLAALRAVPDATSGRQTTEITSVALMPKGAPE